VGRAGRAGRRPVCVLTRPEAIPGLQRVLVAVVTRKARGIPTEVPLGVEDGMPVACVITLDNVETALKALLTERITTLSGPKLHAVCAALRYVTVCG
jgi:mRNA interferase MazF